MENRGVFSKFLSDSGFLVIASILSKLSSFIIIPILTKYLAVSDYGLYDYYITLTMFFIPIISLQLTNGILKFRFSFEEWKSIEKKILFIITILTLISFLILNVFIGSIYTTALLSTLLLFKGITTVYDGILKVQDKVKLTPIGLFSESIFTITLIYLFRNSLDLNKVLEISCIGSIIAFAINFSFSKKHAVHQADNKKSIKTRKLLKSIVLFCIPLIPNSISIWLLRMSNRIVIIAQDGEEANAIFTIAFKYTTILTVLITALNSAWLINVLQNNDQKSEEKVLSLNIHIYAILSSLIIIFAETGIKYLSGTAELNEAVKYVPELAQANFLYAIMALLQGYYIKSGHTRTLFLTTISGGIVNIILSISLYKYLGLYAVSVSMLASYLFIITFRLIQKPASRNINYQLAVSALLIAAIGITYRINMNLCLLLGLIHIIYIYHQYRSEISLASRNIRRVFNKSNIQ